MKSNAMQALSIGLCAVLFVGGIGATVYATNSDKTQEPESPKVPQLIAEDTAELVKDETVYVLTDAAGGVQKIIVSDWIKNRIGSDAVADRSELGDVEVVKGDASYTLNGEHMRVWDAQGKDIYYQGNIEKELPVQLSVSYTLNGAPVSAADLAGKDGKVTIRFQYRNNQYETVEIDGKQEKIYVPFVMLTGMLLDTDVFSHVEVENGKLISDGDRMAVIGWAVPGLQENLQLSEEQALLPDYVEITADVKGFRLGNTVTVAANGLLNRLNTDAFDTAGDLEEQLTALTDAMKQLTDGSSALYAGLNTLLDRSQELVQGIDRLAAGAAKLKAGTDQLDGGTADLKAGTAELLGGLQELTSHNQELENGAATVFTSLLQTVEQQLKANGLTVDPLTIEGYTETLTNLLQHPTDTQKAELIALAKPTLEAELKKKEVPEAQYATVEYMLYERLAAGKTKEEALGEIQTLLTHAVICQTVAAQNPSATTPEQLVQAIAVYLASQQGGQPAQYLQAAQTVAKDAQTVQAAAQKAASPEGQLAINGLCLSLAQQTLKPQIDGALQQLDSYNEFYTGLLDYTAGAAEAADGAAELDNGAAQLKAGAAELKAGMAELYDGILTMKDGAPALIAGEQELCSGAMRLSDGLKEFNEKGVQKLVDAVNGDLAGLLTRLKATVDVSKDYKSFTGLSDSMDGQVKFIYRTASVKADS